MIKAPCKGCEERVLGCHSTCEKYIEYAKAQEEYRQARNKAKILHNNNMDYFCKAIKHNKRSK